MLLLAAPHYNQSGNDVGAFLIALHGDSVNFRMMDGYDGAATRIDRVWSTRLENLAGTARCRRGIRDYGRHSRQETQQTRVPDADECGCSVAREQKVRDRPDTSSSHVGRQKSDGVTGTGLDLWEGPIRAVCWLSDGSRPRLMFPWPMSA
jgi:hypothetical protein